MRLKASNHQTGEPDNESKVTTKLLKHFIKSEPEGAIVRLYSRLSELNGQRCIQIVANRLEF